MKPNQKTKILFVLPSLVPGGAERVISFVANNIDRDIFDPVLVIAGFNKDNAYDVSKTNTIYLKKSRILTAIPFIITTISRLKPDIVVSSISHVNTAMSIISPLFRKTKFIGRESTVLSKRKNEKKPRKWSPAYFLPDGFKNLDKLICQSQDMAEDMIKNYNVPKEKTFVINNPISSLPIIKKNRQRIGQKRFITVGRLTEVKGYERILEILSKLKTPFIYTIIGNGNLKEQIFNKAKELEIEKKIIHIEFSNELNKHFSENDIFLQGSYVEGFPNAVLESCVVGTPVIAFNAPGGTKEIITNGVNGYIVENEQEFLEKLNEEKVWDPKIVRESVYKKFNSDKILKEYEDLFIGVLKNNSLSFKH
ncbi:glycosyltransferase [Winogradskyella sp.]|jgi:glycosyltransferase involved in cell wall biosynthesis|uniref:glycosyltransferase n=1 Tax=Winogradskyella sp. TaxID=1883156 RepID=UPI0025F6E815|nr:glycosyltransferase [Winogradskyella sp.]MCT4629151.1 glycosyltransferase [Winogradskyella sp.]